jgi:hypothetical protein
LFSSVLRLAVAPHCRLWKLGGEFAELVKNCLQQRLERREEELPFHLHLLPPSLLLSLICVTTTTALKPGAAACSATKA